MLIYTLKLASLLVFKAFRITTTKKERISPPPQRNVNIIRYESSTNLKSAEKIMVEKTLKIYYDKAVRLLQGVCI